jgi:hypothetical protein
MTKRLTARVTGGWENQLTKRKKPLAKIPFFGGAHQKSGARCVGRGVTKAVLYLEQRTARTQVPVTILFELEVCLVVSVVVQLHHQLAACVGPYLIRLPNVSICVSTGIVGKTA